MVNQKGKIYPKLLDEAVEKISDKNISEILNYDQPLNEDFDEYNAMLTEFAIDNISQLEDGRLQMPLLWNPKVAHLLGKNFNLARRVLESNLKRLNRVDGGLEMTDRVIEELKDLDIIEKIDNLELFERENPSCTYIPHMPVFRLDKESSPCTVVYLSNLCEQRKGNVKTLSHNQVISSGTNLNSKLLTSLMLLRFDQYLMIFDLVKAFLQISLPEQDQNKLILLWYANVKNKNFEIVAYRTKRLPFGIPLLMIALYKILVLDTETDHEELVAIKKLIFELAYMDNLAFSSPSVDKLNFVYDNIKDVFHPYKFNLQQFATNEPTLSANINQSSEKKVNLLGVLWNTVSDTISMNANA